MSAPLVPSPLDYIGRRRFSFFPPIRCVEPNSWILGAGSWSEVQVINAVSGAEIWVPRQYIGAVSDNCETIIVGLTQDVELRRGDVVQRADCRVIQMPAPPAEPAVRHPDHPASVVTIRLEEHARKTFRKPSLRIGIVVLFVISLLAVVASASR